MNISKYTLSTTLPKIIKRFSKTKEFRKRPFYALRRVSSELEIYLNAKLPHGSGIDCSYTYEYFKNSMKVKNYFHAMDENGYYDGYMMFSFRITLTKNLTMAFSSILCNENRRPSFCGLKEYLNDTYYLIEQELRHEWSSTL